MAKDEEKPAHQQGLTAVAFSPDGRYVYTGGNEGIARAWNAKDHNAEPGMAAEATGPIGLAATKSAWYSAGNDGCVREYSAGTSELVGHVLEIAGSIEANGLAVNPAGTRIAVAAGDNDVKIVDLGDHSNVVTLKGHTRGVRRAAWHPKDPILVTSGEDGHVLVWDTDKNELLHRIEGILPIISDSDSPGYLTDCTPVWHPKGHLFMIVTRNGTVHAYSRHDWEKVEDQIPDLDKTLGAVTAVAIAPTGLYLMIAYTSAVVGYSSSRKEYFRKNIGAAVTQIAWSPTADFVLWGDNAGSLCFLTESVPPGWTKPYPVAADKEKSRGKNKAAELDAAAIWGDAEREKMNLDPDAELDPADDNFDRVDADDDEDEDEDGADAALGLDYPELDRDEHYPREMVSVTKAQPAFQPGATPFQNKKRYLAHNTIGAIEVTDADDHNIVNVEFYDQSTRKGYSFSDNDRYSLAALGERGAIFATEPEKNSSTDKDRPLLPRSHRITYKPYSTWAARSDWSITLPPNERVLAVAAGGVPPRRSMKYASDVRDMEGNGCAIVATSAGFVRFFSGAGLQRYVWAIGGTVVSMVAGSEWVFVVHREGGTSLDGCQNLRYTLVALDNYELVQTGPLPLPKRRTLKWIGITEEGAPAMYDSAGVMSILDRFRRPTQGRWVPILDSNGLERRKGKDESYWPVGISTTTFMCLILKGKQEYPGFPRPLVQEIDVAMPLWNSEDADIEGGNDNVLEEQLMREQLHVMMIADSLEDELVEDDDIEKLERSLDKTIIQLMASACKLGKLQRALDLATLLHRVDSVDRAILLAGFHNMRGLQERLDALKMEMEQRDRHGKPREDRRTWYQHAAPIRAPAAPGYDDARHSASTSFSDNVGNPTRRALAPAVPHSHANPFGKEPKLPAAQRTRQRVEPPPASYDSSIDFGDDSLDTEMFDSPPPSASKRKRVEESMPPPDNVQREPKRRILEEPANKSANPFAKKNTAPKSTALQKSTSFFNKVEASGNEKPKTKPAKAVSKQTTLFGLPAVPPPEKKTKPKKSKTTPAEETQTEETQAEDNEATEVLVEETPEPPAPVPAAQAPGEAETADDDEETPFEWPPSPQASATTLGNDIMVQ